MSSKASGLGHDRSVSTRTTREERRREVERVQPTDPPKAEPAAPNAALTKIAPRRRPSKVAFNTYITAATQQRIESLKGRGYAVTDIAEAALSEFLDRAGVPDADS